MMYGLSLKMSMLGKLCSSTLCSWYVMIANLPFETRMEVFNTGTRSLTLALYLSRALLEM